MTVTSHIMRLFQMGQIWHLLGMKSPAAERSVMVFTQQHELLLTQVFNKWLQMKQLKGKRLSGEKGTLHSSLLQGCHCSALAFYPVSPCSRVKIYTVHWPRLPLQGFLLPLLPMEEN